MRVSVQYGLGQLDLDVPEQGLVHVQRQPVAPALADPVAAVRTALEGPIGFPSLRQALTPDDHVTIIVDEELPRLAELLTPILEHLTSARVMPDAVTLLCPPHSAQQPWLDTLPDAFQDARVEIHDPSERKHHSYVATMKLGRRLYINRSAVDADQLVVLTKRSYDPLLGYAGAAGAIYPTYSDESTRKELGKRFSLAAPDEHSWQARQEAAEAVWLLGAPFFVQVIEGVGEEITHALGGMVDTSAAGDRLLDARWRVAVERPARTVVAALGGDPSRHTFADFARAAGCAARVVQPEGRIIILSQAKPALGVSGELLRRAEGPEQALDELQSAPSVDLAAAFLWASAAAKARIYLHSNLEEDVVEELFAAPLSSLDEAQRLLKGQTGCLVLPDAHKTMAAIKAASAL